jgi:hypothetical protein
MTNASTFVTRTPAAIVPGWGISARAPRRTRAGVIAVRRWSDDAAVAALAITVVAVMMAVLIAIAGSLAMAGASAAEVGPSAGPLVSGVGGGATTVQVRAVRVFARPGDSLWSIALSVAPDEDPRRVVLRLDRARGRSGPLQAGELILVATSR